MSILCYLLNNFRELQYCLFFIIIWHLLYLLIYYPSSLSEYEIHRLSEKYQTPIILIFMYT